MWITLNNFLFKMVNYDYNFNLKNHNGYLNSSNTYYYNCCYGIKRLYFGNYFQNTTMYLICG